MALSSFDPNMFGTLGALSLKRSEFPLDVAEKRSGNVPARVSKILGNIFFQTNSWERFIQKYFNQMFK